MTRVFLCLVVAISLCEAWKLNVPRVLLPLADEGAKFLVYSEGGCFIWSSTRPEIVKANPTLVSEECGNSGENFLIGTQQETTESATVTGCTSAAIIQLPPRWGGAPTIAKTQAVVTAEDAHSDGHILRCDVIVDRIHRLQIVTKTLELFLEEAPEEFSVMAYDDQGNVFSTLEGIVFTWTVESSSAKGDNVKFIKFRDSTYALEPALMSLEAKGLQGSKVLLEGVRTGSSKVTVRLASKSYADVPPAEVTIMVVANLFLVPHFTAVISGGIVEYHAEQMRANRIHTIDLTDSQQYFIEVADDIAKTHPNLKNAIVAGGEHGETIVYLRDNNVGREDAVKSPSADLHVVAPSYIMIDINPHNNWNVIVGQEYSLHVSVYDANNRKLFPSANLVAELEVESGYFDVKGKTENGTWLSGLPTTVGSAGVRAVLTGVKDVYTGEVIALAKPLKAKAQMDIFAPIDLEPRVSYFPWDPISNSMTQVVYKILGHESSSSSSFTWTAANKSVATVAQNGIAKTTGNLGETKIVASMTRASHNRGEAMIFVLPIVGIEIIKNRELEVIVGDNLILPLTMWGQGNRKFTKCDQLHISTSLADKSIAQLEPNSGENGELPSDACSFITLKGLSMGFTKVTVSHQYTTNEGKAVKVSDVVTIAVLDPLTPVQPSSGITVLSVGSSVDIVWKGGPQAWIMQPETHYHNVKIDDESLVEVQRKKSVPLNYYVNTMTCRKVGETQVEIQVGNAASSSLVMPFVLKHVITVFCADPERLQLEASPERPEGPCPMMARNGRIAALCYDDLLINVSVYDSSGRKFDNYSSLEITWDNSDASLGDLQKEKGVIYDEANEGISFYKPFGIARGHQILLTKKLTGSLEITATLKKSSYLLGRSISDTLELELVEEAAVSPAKASLFNHVDSLAHFTINHGSGFFEVTSSEAGIANHKYTATNRSIQVSPSIEGSTILKIRDLCLTSSKSTSEAIKKSQALVNVIGVHKVDLKVIDQVQIGTEVTAQVDLWDQFGEKIDVASIPSARLSIQVVAANKDIALVNPASKRFHFLVKGAALGHTTLTAVVTYGKRRVSSKAMPLHVFPALELEPRNITLIIGAQFQVQVLGGPGQLDSSIEFSIGSTKIANLDSAGLISALTLGSTKVTARAVGSNKATTTGQKVIFSSDSVDVHVVKLDGVKIKAPITKMRVGTEMPLAMVGLDKDNQNGFAFGSALPILDVEWKISNQEVAALKSPFWRNGLTPDHANNGAMRLLARKPGRTTIKLNTRITAPIDLIGQNQLDRDMEFSDEIEVIVFEDLNGKSPYIGRNNVLMGPMSEHQLRTNRDGVSGAKTTFTLLPSVDGSDVVTVSKTGKVTSKRLLGTAVILVRTIEDNAVVQEMSIVVQVKSVSYMMLNAMSVIQPKNPLTSWPLGLKLPLDISFHDESGVKFDAVDETLLQHGAITRPNRFDTNQIKTEKKNGNSSLAIELVEDELTVLKTSCGSSLSDFLIFNVQSAITPHPKKIGVGDVLILDTLMDTAKAGKWSAEPSDIVHIDTIKGVAVAMQVGNARIFHHIDNDLKMTFNVEIVKAKKISFQDLEQGRHLTNVKDKVQAVPVNIITDITFDGDRRLNNAFVSDNANLNNAGDHYSTKTLFQCKAKFKNGKNTLNNIFRVEPGFHQGNYGCLFTALEDISQFNDDIEITAIPNAPLEGVNVEKTIVPFSSAVKLLSSQTLVLTNLDSHGELALAGLDNVLDGISITLSDNHFMYVGRSFSKGDDVRAWPIGLKAAFWTEGKPGTELSLTVASTVTDQTFEIPVKVTFRGDLCANIELGWSSLLYFMAAHYQSLLFILASCVICVFITRLLTQAASKAASKPSAQAPATNNNANFLNSPLQPRMQNGGSPSTTLLNSDSKPYLWTANDSPVYGSPTSSTSPYSRRSPRSLAQYSYSNH